MAVDYSKFDAMADLDGLHNDVKSAEQGNGNFDEVPYGAYEVKIDKMEITETKKTGEPMFTCWFEILAGEQKGRKIFMNQVITKGFQIHIVNEFLRSLDTGYDVQFEKYSDYAKLITTIRNAILLDGLEYALEYGEKKGWKTFEIKKVFAPAPDNEADLPI